MARAGCAGRRVEADALREGVAVILAGAGLAEGDAAAVARALVRADLRGQDTHGSVRVSAYLKRLGAGLLNPRPRIATEARMPFAVTIDADNAMGHVAAERAVLACLERAETLGIGAATVRRSNHFGAASVYTLPAVERGCIGIAMAPGAKSLAPYGSREPLLGTNPIAVSVPSGRYAPWTLDMAASVAARGHVRLALQRGERIPEGWALDEEGQPTTDPERALCGVMLPFAGPKGSAISMMVDIFAGVLAGSGFAGDIPDWTVLGDAPADVGHFFLVMKVEAFMPLREFEQRMETAIERLKALQPASGFDEVLYPGEIRGRIEEDRTKNGVPLDPAVETDLRDLARAVGATLRF